MRRVLIAAVLLIAAGFAASCGGGGGDGVKLPPGDEGAIQKLFMDFVKAKDRGDSDALAQMYSSQCADRETDAKRIVNHFRTFAGDIDIKIRGVEFDQLQADFAVATPKADLDVKGLEPQEAATTSTELVREDGVWKISTCGYNIPSLDQPVDFS